MSYRLTGPLAGLFFLVSLLLHACAPVPAANSDNSSSTADALVRSAEGRGSAANKSDYNSASSLDALSRGEFPSSGPLKDIYFDFDRYDLRPDARATLKANAAWLTAHPSARVEIEGHCDDRGTNEYNLALGARRAQAAQDYLVTLGISPRRVKSVSYGEEIPVCRERSEDCRWQNRHDRFVVSSSGPVS